MLEGFAARTSLSSSSLWLTWRRASYFAVELGQYPTAIFGHSSHGDGLSAVAADALFRLINVVFIFCRRSDMNCRRMG